MSFPALFVSHGSPNLILHDGPTRRFLAQLGASIGRPRAVVAVSAHWEAGTPTVNANAWPETIHDFYGFEPEMYQMRYPAPGATDLAQELVRRLADAGMRVAADDARGLDHGVWVPLKLMYPQADIPVTQISVQPLESTEHHCALGERLRDLRADDVLVLASGNATHNLREMMPDGTAAPGWVEDFARWLRERVVAGRFRELLEYRASAPFAARNHPTEEHILPLFAALGAATPGTNGRVLHTGTTFGVLAMDAFAFD